MTPKKAAPRVEAHLQKLRDAGLDMQAFVAALIEIRDDTLLSVAQREALHQMIAMESFVWYLEALKGSALDRDEIAAAAKNLIPSPSSES